MAEDPADPPRGSRTSGTKSDDLKLRDIRRSPETVELDPDSIVLPDFDVDPTFQVLYANAIQGQHPVAFSRLPVEEIQCGFSRMAPDGLMEVVDSPPATDEDVRAVARQLRQGHRPALHLYPGGHEPGRTHVCSDDCAALRAYKLLGIAMAPVLLLQFKPTTLRHPALVYRYAETGAAGGPVRIFDTVEHPSVHPGVPRVHLDPLSTANAESVLSGLAAALSGSLERLRQFHRIGGDVHYHETVGSVLVRAIRIVRAIEAVLPTQVEQGLVLLRALYELSLNLHLDWLSPEAIGPIFLMHGQGAAVGMTNSKMNSAINEVEEQRIASGWNPAVAKDSSRGMRSQLDLVQKADRKASVFPLGVHHKGIYAHLSHLSHQDFVAGERFLHVLDGSLTAEQLSYPKRDSDAAMLLKLADCCVADICACVDSDIGIADDV